MTIHLPDELVRDVEAEVSRGRFASVDEAMAEAARLLLRRRRVAVALPPDLTDAEREDLETQWRLFDAGLLSEIKPPIRDLTPYRDRAAVPIDGEPLSETVIRERR